MGPDGIASRRPARASQDLVLIYAKIGDDTLSLVRLGSHSELFG
jgi:mRNA-degrading endonuclease YafQ of YafQ-DinJ toxin-antitoxin module